jgi:hypothetical protein
VDSEQFAGGKRSLKGDSRGSWRYSNFDFCLAVPPRGPLNVDASTWENRFPSAPIDPCKIAENRPKSWVLGKGWGIANDFEFSTFNFVLCTSEFDLSTSNFAFSTSNFETKTIN